MTPDPSIKLLLEALIRQGKAQHEEFLASLERNARETTKLRELVSGALAAVRDAEREIPEWMRRFANYMHDVHDIKYMYEEHGVDVPKHVLREIERLDDRYRQLLAEANMEGGAFNKVRREMASDPKNRYDHTRQLEGPTHTKVTNG